MRIDRIEARAISDSRGRPTVEVILHAGTLHAMASVPSGKSTGSHEAVELRAADGGVMKVLGNITGEIASELAARDFSTPDALDGFLVDLDGTPDKARLGANAILAVSIASQRLFAEVDGVPLWKAIEKRGGFAAAPPQLYVNLINGGAHANFRLPFQEHMLVCKGKTSEAFAIVRTAFAKLGARLGDVPMGDEGGYAPVFDTLEKPFELLASLVDEYPRTRIAIDAAANELRANAGYDLLGKHLKPTQLAQVYEGLAAHFPLHSIEDPFSEDASADFAYLTDALRGECLVVGDDFTATNPLRIERAAREQAINAVLIKPNQIGSVKEAIEAVCITRSYGWEPICSHRSGETMDTFIADFAYGVGAHGIKAGGFAQKERIAKYERLLEIEREAAE